MPYIADIEAVETGWRIVLPWPDKRLSPNARLHWRAKVAPKQAARIAAGWATVASPGFREAKNALARTGGPIPIVVRFYPPDKRYRDDDNMIGAFKCARDGLAEALGVDDRRFRPEYRFADPEKPGRIEVEVGHG
jgi:crossover junction endodeoxyribonuclease RusA